jgi:hypothetical protein
VFLASLKAAGLATNHQPPPARTTAHMQAQNCRFLSDHRCLSCNNHVVQAVVRAAQLCSWRASMQQAWAPN